MKCINKPRKEVRTMKLTWRDGVTTLLAAAIVGLYYAVTRGVDLPLIGTSQLSAIVTMGILAVVIGFVGMEQRDVEEEGWLGTMLAVGLGAIGLFIASLFYTTQTMFLAVTIGIVALWGVGMLHHMVSSSDHIEAPA
jgi:drug/metabolite transporter (DMT)-like permease